MHLRVTHNTQVTVGPWTAQPPSVRSFIKPISSLDDGFSGAAGSPFIDSKMRLCCTIRGEFGEFRYLNRCSRFCFVFVKDHFSDNSGDFFKDGGVSIGSALDSSSLQMELSSAETESDNNAKKCRTCM